MESSKIWLAGDATNMTEARLTPDAGPTMSNMTTSRTSSVSVARSVASSGAQEAAQTMLGLGVSRSQLQCPSVTSGPQQVLVLHIGQVSKKLRERAATGEDLRRFKYWSIEQNSIVKDVYLFPIGYTAIVVYQREFYVLYITEQDEGPEFQVWKPKDSNQSIWEPEHPCKAEKSLSTAFKNAGHGGVSGPRNSGLRHPNIQYALYHELYNEDEQRIALEHMRNTRLEEDKLRLITTRQDVLPVPRREQPTGSDAARFAELLLNPPTLRHPDPQGHSVLSEAEHPDGMVPVLPSEVSGSRPGSNASHDATVDAPSRPSASETSSQPTKKPRISPEAAQTSTTSAAGDLAAPPPRVSAVAATGAPTGGASVVVTAQQLSEIVARCISETPAAKQPPPAGQHAQPEDRKRKAESQEAKLTRANAQLMKDVKTMAREKLMLRKKWEELGGKLQHAHDEAKIEAEEKATVVQQLQACDAERKHLKEQVHQLTGSSADSSLSITHLESVLSRVLQTLKQREAQPVQMPAVAAGSILSTPADSMQQNLQKAQQIAREAEACEPCTAEFINLTTKVHKLTEPTPRYKEQLAAVERHSNNINAAAQQLTPKLSQAIKLCEQLIEKVKILIQSQQV